MKNEKLGDHGLQRQVSAPPPRRRAASNYQTVEDVAAERGGRSPTDRHPPQSAAEQPIATLTSCGPIRPPRPGAGSFELLQAKFGFQEGNVRNQKEHFEVWVLNYESRVIDTALTPVDTENAILAIHAKFFRNYKKWCKFLHTQPYLLDTAPYPGAAERQAALFLLIWGESANLRFMPECLCFLYHRMAAKLDGIENLPNAPEGAFLCRVVRPLYSVIAKMRNMKPKKNGAPIDHKNVTNYDDVNEFFWKETCLKFDEFTAAEAVKVKDFKTFKERRSFCNPMLAFFRIYFFLFVMLHILIVIAYVAHRSEPTSMQGFEFYANFFTPEIEDIRNHSLFSILITVSGLLTLKVVLDVWIDGIRVFSRVMYAVSVFCRLVWHAGFLGFFATVNVAPYDVLFGNDLLSLAPFATTLYLTPIVIIAIVQMCFRGLIWRSGLLSSLDGTSEQYVGRTMGQSWGDFLCYGTFWTIIFVCKFLFNLQLMVKPLIGPSVEIYNVDVSSSQLEDGIISGEHNIAFLLAMWVPMVLVYIYDSQIWLAIAQAVVGAWIGFRLKIGHSTRIGEFVTRLHQAPALFDKKVVSAAARGQLAMCNNSSSSTCVTPDANSRLRFAVVWNEIVSGFRLSDLLDDRETAILQYQISDTGVVEEPVFLIAGEAQMASDIAAKSKTKRMSDAQLFKELKKAGVLGCAKNCVDILFQILRQVLGHQDTELIGAFHQILAGGRVSGVVNLTHIGLVRENVIDLLASILDLPEPTVGPAGGTAGVPHENVLLVVQRVDALLKSIELMLEEEWIAEKIRKSAFTRMTPDLSYQKEQLLLIFDDRISQPNSSPRRTTSPSSNENVMSLATRLFFLLTLDAADALPRCHEAQRRMSFFLNSLHMKIPNIESIAAMKSFSVITPYYNETVLFSIDELNGRVDSNPLFMKVEQKGRDISILKYLVTFHDDEWGNFLERVGVDTMEEALAECPTQVRLWASMRGQTLARTVHGMMMYEDALKMLRWLEIGSDDNISHLEKIKHMDRIAGLKFSYVTSCQIYADQLAAGDSRAADIDLLMRKYPNWRVSYVDTIRPSVGSGEEPRFDCVLVKSDGDEIVEVYRYELPGNPMVGEGKPENQNVALPFTRGEYLQTIDMNQEHYFEEALKIPNFLATATANGKNVTIIGMKEHIFTGRASSLAHFMTLQELVFVSLTMRVLANPLQSRMHYGHPDVFEKSFVMSNGGVSKASKGINLSEDVFAGYNVALRGEKVTHQEFMQCGKGRDVTLSQINAFEAKLSNGSAESSLSRESHRMGAGMDFFRLNSMFYGHMGFYICNALVVLCVFAYAYGKVYIVLRQEIEETAITTTNYLDDLAEVMNTQFIFQFGMLMTIPLIATLFVEYGWRQAVVNFVELIVTLGPVFYIFETGTKSHFYDVAIMRGGSKYRGTGRGFAIVRETMVNFYKEYAASHYRKAVELMGLMIIFGVYGNFDIGSNVLAEFCATADFDCDTHPDQIPSNITLLNAYRSKGQDYGIASFAVWLLGACWLLAPFLFNTDGLDFSKTRADITHWLSWLMSVKEENDDERLLPNHAPSVPTDTWNDFYNYEASLMYPVGSVSRVAYAVRELRHPLVMYYVFIHSFDLNDIVLLLGCVGGITVLLWIGGFSLGLCLRNKARVPRAMLYVLMVIMIGVTPFIVGSTQDWDSIKSFSLTVSTFTGLFSILHYLQLLHGVFGLPIAKWGLVRELAFFFDVVVGLFMAFALLVLSAFPFMKTIQTRMMYNGGFSRALSSDSEFAASLSVIVGGLGGFTYGWLTCLIFSLGYVNSASDNFVNQSFAYFNNEMLSRAIDLSMVKVYAAGASVAGVIVSGGLSYVIGRRWTIAASCLVTLAGCAPVWIESSALVLIGICMVSGGIAMLSLVCPLYNFEVCLQGWKGKGVLMFLTSAALGYLIVAVLINDVNATAMSENWNNSPHHDWQWQFIFGIIPIVLLLPCVFFFPESHYWEYRHKRDIKAAETTLIRLRQRHDVLEEVNEMKESFVVKEGRVNIAFRIILVTVLQSTFALFTSGALLPRVLVQPLPTEAGERSSKWMIYYGALTFVGTVLSLLTVDSLRRKTIFKDVLPFSAMLSAACGALGFVSQEQSSVTQIVVCVAFVSGTLSLTCGTWLTAIEVFPPYQNGRYIAMSFAVYYAAQAIIYVAEPSFASSHLFFAALCLLLTFFMFIVCASSKYGAIELKSEKKMRKQAEASHNVPSLMTGMSRSHTFLRSRSRSQAHRLSSHYSASATPHEGSYSNFESPAGFAASGGARRALNGSQGM